MECSFLILWACFDASCEVLQALMYPILVACKSQSAQRRDAAMGVVDRVREHSAALVEQAQLVLPPLPPTHPPTPPYSHTPARPPAPKLKAI